MSSLMIGCMDDFVFVEVYLFRNKICFQTRPISGKLTFNIISMEPVDFAIVLKFRILAMASIILVGTTSINFSCGEFETYFKQPTAVFDHCLFGMHKYYPSSWQLIAGIK